MRKLVLIMIFSFAVSTTAKSQCAACGACKATITDTVNGNISWGGSDTYCIAAGAVVNGNVSISGSTSICNAGIINGKVSATGSGSIRNTGIINGDLEKSNSVTICNEGKIMNGSYTSSGSGDLVSYGTLMITGDVTIGGSGGIVSSCIVKVGGNYTLSGSTVYEFVKTTTVGGNLITSGSAGVLINGNLIIAGDIQFNSSSPITLAKDAYLSVKDFKITQNSRIVIGPTTAGDTAQIVITGTGATPGTNAKFTKNLKICGTCTCDDDGKPVYSTAPCPSAPVLSAPSAICANSITLPIELITFEAKAVHQNVVLYWVTATEINNDYFTIERSQDAINWKEVLKVKGAGNAHQTLNYSAIDGAPFSGTSYYRLKQTDFDGQFTYSQIRSVNFKGVKGEIKIYPNPAKGSFEFILTESANELRMDIRDAQGKIVLSQTYFNIEEGVSIAVDIAHLAQGVYTVSFLSEKDIVNQKLVLK